VELNLNHHHSSSFSSSSSGFYNPLASIIIVRVIKSGSLSGGPCGTHEKDEKCESENQAKCPRLEFTFKRKVYDPWKRP
jgi:hypothetical protein